MGLFGSVRIAPGLRISTSARGLRAHVGPRFARLHVGGGRTGVSTGAGPFTLYGNADPRRTTTSRATPGLTATQAQRERQVAEVSEAWARLEALHRMTFQPATAPAPPTPEPLPVFSALLADAERRELAGVSLWDRSGRAAARTRARSAAERQAMELMVAADHEVTRRRYVVSSEWHALATGDPARVQLRLTEVLEPRGGATVSVRPDGVVEIVLPALDDTTLPSHRPDFTPTGRPTLVRLTKTERAARGREVLAARVLLAAKECLAESPATSDLIIAVGTDTGDCLLRAHLTRDALAQATWVLGAWDVLLRADPQLQHRIGGRTQELLPLR